MAAKWWKDSWWLALKRKPRLAAYCHATRELPEIPLCETLVGGGSQQLRVVEPG